MRSTSLAKQQTPIPWFSVMTTTMRRRSGASRIAPARVDMLATADQASPKPHYPAHLAARSSHWRTNETFAGRSNPATLRRAPRLRRDPSFGELGDGTAGGTAAKPPSCRRSFSFRPNHRKRVRQLKRLMAALGLCTTRERTVADRGEAAAAAAEMGYPVVLKALSDEIPHKSDHGLVLVGLENADDVEAAWDMLQARIAALDPSVANVEILLQEMVSGGIETFWCRAPSRVRPCAGLRSRRCRS